METKHLYNKHIQTSHINEKKCDSKYFRCDVCEIDFYVPGAMIHHNKFVHRQDDLPCLGHSKKLKMYMQVMIQIFYCPFCGEEFDNKMNLNKHMGDDHSDENQSPEDILRCPLCEAVFYHLDAYELHLTYHSVEDLYTERNDMVEQITDFSLETVSPMQEKVENAEPTPNFESDGEPSGMIGIEQLLELTMEEPKKSKKHKKHKKSKKAAITLDEFLNMNKDVFGEGIDIQGVEEVPTQVIANSLKTKKLMAKPKPASSDLEKLKRQGIVIKKKTPQVINKVMTLNKTASLLNLNQQQKPSQLKSSEDVLSRLLNNSSQIKIVKKSNTDIDPETNTDQQCQREESTELVTSKEDGHELTENETQQHNNDNDIENANTDTYVDNIIPKESPEELENKTTTPDPAHSDNPTETLEAISNDRNSNSDKGEKTENVINDTTLNTICNNKKTQDEVLSSKPNSPMISVNDEIIEGHAPEQIDILTNDISESKNVSQTNSLSAFKHLSHLTIKPVQQTQQPSINDTPDATEKAQSPQTSSKENQIPSNIKHLSQVIIKPSSTNAPTVESTNSEHEHRDNSDGWESEDDQNLANVLDHASHLKGSQSSPQNTITPQVIKSNDDHNSKSNMDIFKHLKNITAKPVAGNSLKMSAPVNSSNSVNKTATFKTMTKTEITKEGIEIFSIDDSDSDEANCGNSTVSETIKREPNTDSPGRTGPAKEAPAPQNIRLINKVHKSDNKSNDHRSDEVEAKKSQDKSHNLKADKQQAINNVLKNLGKNITIKSRTSSPSQPFQPNHEHNSRSGDERSRSRSPSGGVLITEVEPATDDELDEQVSGDHSPHNVLVEHPDDSDSDDGATPRLHHDSDDATDDEPLLSTATLKIEEVGKSNLDDVSAPLPDDRKSASSTSSSIDKITKNLSNQISIKQIKKPDVKNESSHPKSNTRVESNVPRQPVSQNATSSNHSNTFNREIKTVKTFQSESKTVIQEITTTVTKTIKTVNQTMKQELRNTSQSNAPTIMNKMPRVNAPVNKFHGIRVRASPPAVRQHVRGPAPAPPAAPGLVTPIRPRLHRPMIGPRSRMINANSARPLAIQTRPPVMQARPQSLKISPGVANAAKRPSDEPGHFSCFKKPKESLIPVPDIPVCGGDALVQVSSAAQMTKSNFSSTTKTIKGNSVVTCSQAKSEASASSQQVSRLKNVSGLVVKSSQFKQTHVEEKSEMTTANKVTLDAIQRLQSQGLLVKKPRMEVCDKSERSNSNDREFDEQVDDDDA